LNVSASNHEIAASSRTPGRHPKRHNVTLIAVQSALLVLRCAAQLNFLTIVTEFIGAALALEYFHINRTITVPIAAAALIAIVVTGSFRRWERAMFVFLIANVLVVPLIWLAHPDYAQLGRGPVVPGVQGLSVSITPSATASLQPFIRCSLHGAC
jgi:Mn2+/Fe2+ NRAMP family transporter